jgi:hypothetical protein
MGWHSASAGYSGHGLRRQAQPALRGCGQDAAKWPSEHSCGPPRLGGGGQRAGSLFVASHSVAFRVSLRRATHLSERLEPRG